MCLGLFSGIWERDGFSSSPFAQMPSTPPISMPTDVHGEHMASGAASGQGRLCTLQALTHVGCLVKDGIKLLQVTKAWLTKSGHEQGRLQVLPRWAADMQGVAHEWCL